MVRGPPYCGCQRTGSMDREWLSRHHSERPLGRSKERTFQEEEKCIQRTNSDLHLPPRNHSKQRHACQPFCGSRRLLTVWDRRSIRKGTGSPWEGSSSILVPLSTPSSPAPQPWRRDNFIFTFRLVMVWAFLKTQPVLTQGK